MCKECYTFISNFLQSVDNVPNILKLNEEQQEILQQSLVTDIKQTISCPHKAKHHNQPFITYLNLPSNLNKPFNPSK